MVYVDTSGKITETVEFIFKTTNNSLTSSTSKAVVWDYVIDDGTNFRAGTITAVWDGNNVEYNEVSTNCIGTILNSTFSFSVIIDGDYIVLYSTITSGTWSVSTSRKMIG